MTMRTLIKRLCLTAAFVGCSATTAHADIIFSDDFEATQTIERWQVYQTLSDGEWTVTEGSGVEVQDSVIVDAHSGSQYIELDSSFRRGGTNSTDGTNSAITRELTGLAAGDYLLEYYYQPRTDTIDDNIISVYGDSAQDDLFQTLLDTANGVGADGWLQRSVSFSVAENNTSLYLSFRAEGVENSLGGFVDSVRLERVAAPAGIGFVLLGLFAMGAATRRKRVHSR